MGRAKIKKELISNERGRRTTFHRRVKGLKKKMFEFSTLTDVKACLVIYGPKQGDKDNMLVEPETWPEDQNHVWDILNQFQKCDVKERGKREVGIEESLKNQSKKLRAELDGFKKQNDQTKYPTWDQRLDNFSLDQLRTLSDQLDWKLELVKQKLDRSTEEHELELLKQKLDQSTEELELKLDQSREELELELLKQKLDQNTEELELELLKQKLDQSTEELELDLWEEAIEYFSAQPDDLHHQPLSSYVKTMDQCLPLDCTSYSESSVDCSNFCTGESSSTDLRYIYAPSMDYFHSNSSMLPTLDHDEFVFNNSCLQAGGYYAMDSVAAATSSHHNSFMLPSLDHQIVFNNSSQAVNIQQMPSFFLNPES